MAQLLPHGMPLIEEDEASEEIAEIYAAIKREMQTPYVPNWAKALAVSPAALKMYIGMIQSFYDNLTLPMSLAAIICYTIAEKNHCDYCAATNELTCRTLGVDDETLSAISTDLSTVTPDRIRGIIEFALKVAKNPKGLSPKDYDEVRAYGISNEEIMEIILIAGMATLNDVMADSLKIEVDSEVADALAK